MNKTFCVISHTHWDREWYFTFEQFRIKLIDLIDNLLDILANDPSYIFHLDAQTVVLEDYLEIKPYQRVHLEKYIKSGNIIVGPWYVQNDFYLSSAEATVRNLLIGMKIAEDFGKCAKIGYTPDQFGLPGQLPQIFNDFGLKSHIFGRGYAKYENGRKIPQSAEFIWQSPDGSEVFSVIMPFWYNNAQRFSENIDKSVLLVNKMKEAFKDWTDSQYILMMNGVDHLEAQENLKPILEKVNERLDDGKVVQMSMQDYIDMIM